MNVRTSPERLIPAGALFPAVAEQPIRSGFLPEDRLRALGESLALQRAYHRDGEAIMTAFGLSDEQKKALRSGNLDAVKVQCGGVGVFNGTVSVILSVDD